MKNKLLIVFLILILAIFVINNINVYAADDDDNNDTDNTDTTETTPAWPKEYSYEDYKFTIKGIDLNLYKITANENSNNSIEDNLTDNEEMMNYLNETPTKVIHLDPTKYEIELDHRLDKLGGINTLFINLNLDLTKEDLSELLESEINALNDNENYIVDIVLNYKLDEYPEKYKYFAKMNYFRAFFQTFISLSNQSISFNPEIDITNDTSQILNLAVVEKKDGKIHFERELTEDNGWVDYVKNYTMLSEEEIKLFSTEEPDYTKMQLVMFHDIDNLNYLIENMKSKSPTEVDEDNDNFNNLIDKLNESQQVAVPNTAKSQSTVIFMVGTVSLLSGILLIVYSIKMKEFIKLRNKETI